MSLDYESNISREQNLTFTYARSFMESYGVTLTEETYLSYGLIDEEGKYTNLALLLSDQCKHTIKVTFYGDEENTDIKERREFHHSLCYQMEETFSYLASRKPALKKKEKSVYPMIAFRDAFLNAIVHRDYDNEGSILIDIHPQRMEIYSPGGIPMGLTIEDIQNGVSLFRNKKFAEIFHQMKLIDSFGIGIKRIYQSYQGFFNQPSIHTTPHSFLMILPDQNAID